MKPRRIHLLWLATISGSCGLAYEVLYQRSITLLLGDSPAVNAALFATFLTGVGLGSRFAHRFSRFLFLSEFICGAYAVIFPWLLVALKNWSGLYALTGHSHLALFATGALVLVPGLTVGFALPLFSLYLKEESSLNAFSRVFTLYHVGAVVGIVLVEALLLRYGGTKFTFVLLGLCNVGLGLALLPYRKQSHREAPDQASFPKPDLLRLASASFVSGIYQMLLLSFIFHLFHPHRENFALALVLVFLGLSIGAEIAKRRELSFQTWCAWVTLGLVVSILSHPSLTALYRGLQPNLGVKLLVAGLFALPTLIALGALIPSLMKQKSAVARDSGQLLFLSSLANVVGYLSYVTVLHPYFDKLHLLVFMTLVMTCCAISWRSRSILVMLALGLVSLLLAYNRWDEALFHFPKYDKNYWVEVYKSGPDTAVMLSSKRSTHIAHNGHYSIRVQHNGLLNLGEAMAGIASACYAPRRERALVMGHGSGITAGATALFFEQTDVVEINGAFLAMAPRHAEFNFHLTQNPKATVTQGDARAFLVGKSQYYDLVLNSITRPTYFAAGKVYTREFYQLVQQALRSDGVYATWLSTEMSGEEIMVILRTLKAVFPHANLHLVDRGYYLVICSSQPPTLSTVLDGPGAKESLKLLNARFPGLKAEEIMNDLQLSTSLFEHEFEGPINTDDLPLLEFLAVRAFEQRYRGFDPMRDHAQELGIDPVRSDALSPPRLARRAALYFLIKSRYWQDFERFLQSDSRVDRAFSQWLQRHPQRAR